MQASFFVIEASAKRFPGFHNPDVNWNGWACPAFTTATVHEIIADCGESEFTYDAQNDRFVETQEGQQYPVSKTTGPDGQSLHYFADGWCWDEDARRGPATLDIGEGMRADGTARPALGFDWGGTFITDPTVTDCGRFQVDPVTHYGLTPAQVEILTYGEEQQAFIVRAVKRGQIEIIAEVIRERISPNIKNFGELHDYIDANELGGLCEDEISDEGNRLFPERTGPDTVHTQGLMDACNVIQDMLNTWVQTIARHIDAAAEAGLDAGCASIQAALGLTDGGFAGLFFSGDARDEVRENFARYYWHQLADMADDEGEAG